MEAQKRQSEQNGMQTVVIVILMASALSGIDTTVIWSYGTTRSEVPSSGSWAAKYLGRLVVSE